jgi:hypothetical protein
MVVQFAVFLLDDNLEVVFGVVQMDRFMLMYKPIHLNRCFILYNTRQSRWKGTAINKNLIIVEGKAKVISVLSTEV